MGRLEIVCPNYGALVFAGDRLHDGHDFVLRSNCNGAMPDYLLFFDSRGVSRQFENSLAHRLVARVEARGKSYLLICRPLELTTWATLFNFMALNEVQAGTLVTNMGFVDFTPKKQSILVDAVQQVEAKMGRGIATSDFVETYVSATGQSMSLFSMKYEGAYREKVEEIIARQPSIIINTPIVDASIRIKRERPGSFFSGLSDTEKFNRSIGGADIINLPDFDESLTYDAVHYTDAGNELIFRRLESVYE